MRFSSRVEALVIVVAITAAGCLLGMARSLNQRLSHRFLYKLDFNFGCSRFADGLLRGDVFVEIVVRKGLSPLQL